MPATSAPRIADRDTATGIPIAIIATGSQRRARERSDVEACHVQSERQHHGDDAPELDRVGGRAGRPAEGPAGLDRDEVGVLVQAGDASQQVVRSIPARNWRNPMTAMTATDRHQRPQDPVELGPVLQALGGEEGHTRPREDRGAGVRSEPVTAAAGTVDEVHHRIPHQHGGPSRPNDDAHGHHRPGEALARRDHRHRPLHEGHKPDHCRGSSDGAQGLDDLGGWDQDQENHVELDDPDRRADCPPATGPGSRRGSGTGTAIRDGDHLLRSLAGFLCPFSGGNDPAGRQPAGPVLLVPVPVVRGRDRGDPWRSPARPVRCVGCGRPRRVRPISGRRSGRGLTMASAGRRPGRKPSSRSGRGPTTASGDRRPGREAFVAERPAPDDRIG